MRIKRNINNRVASMMDDCNNEITLYGETSVQAVYQKIAIESYLNALVDALVIDDYDFVSGDGGILRMCNIHYSDDCVARIIPTM